MTNLNSYRIVRLVALLCAFGYIQDVGAEDAVPERSVRECFAFEDAGNTSLLDFMSLDFERAEVSSPSADAEPVTDSDPYVYVSVQYKEKGLPNTTFGSSNFACRGLHRGDSINTTITCHSECDGRGYIHLAYNTPDALQISLGSEIFMTFQRSLAFPDEGTFSAEFKGILKRYPAQFCESKQSEAIAVAESFINLRPGDFGPYVGIVKKDLRKLGLLRDEQDWSYTLRTAAAVSSFQSAAGLPTTGYVDAATYKSLRRSAMVGSC